MSYFVDPDIKNMTRIFPDQGRYDYHRYDMNENPSGLPEEFVEEVKKEITPEFLAIYPEPNKFIDKYTEFVGNGLKRENVTVTNGSDTAIRYVLQTFGEKGKKVVTVAPSFEMYWVNCMLLGLKHFPVSYNDDLTIDVDKIVEAIDDETRIVVLLNPNNPVGNAYTEEEAIRVIDAAKEHNAIVVIDEAYHYFYDKTFLKLALERDNVVLLRTFSKLMSLAAVRLGVIIGHPELIKYVNNLKLTFDVNSVALLFGERILERPGLIKELREIEEEGKEYTLKELEKAGYWTKSCLGNFIFVRPKGDAKEITQRLKDEKKVLVHAYGKGLLENLIRVSTGSKEDMKIFVDAFLEVDK